MLLAEAHEPFKALVWLFCLSGSNAHPHGPAQQGRGGVRHRPEDLRLVDEVPHEFRLRLQLQNVPVQRTAHRRIVLHGEHGLLRQRERRFQPLDKLRPEARRGLGRCRLLRLRGRLRLLRRCLFLLRLLLLLRCSSDGHDTARQTLLHAAQAGIERLGIQTGLRLAQAHKAELGVDAAVRAGIEARRRIAQDGRDAQQLARAEQRLQRAQLLRRADSGDHLDPGLRGRAQDEQVARHGAQLVQHGAEVLALGILRVENRECCSRIMPANGLHERRRLPRAREAEDLAGLVDRHRALRSGGALVEQAHRIAQTAVCQPRQKRSRIRLELDALLIGDIIQTAHDILRHDAPEGEALAARQDRSRHLMQLRRRQNEQQVLRRLLDDLEQGVERAQREHMHLVDDIHALFDLRRGIDGVVAQSTDAVHAVIRGGVDLQHVHARARIDAPAGGAAVAGVAVLRIFAVHGLGQNFSAGRLAGAARAREQIGMAQAAGLELILQSLGHALLTDDVVKGLRAVFAVKCLIHVIISQCIVYAKTAQIAIAPVQKKRGRGVPSARSIVHSDP